MRVSCWLPDTPVRVTAWDASQFAPASRSTWLAASLPEHVWRFAAIAGMVPWRSSKRIPGGDAGIWAAGVTRAALSSATRADIAFDEANRRLFDPQVSPTRRQAHCDAAVADIMFTQRGWQIAASVAGHGEVWINTPPVGWWRLTGGNPVHPDAWLQLQVIAAELGDQVDRNTWTATQAAVLDDPDRWMCTPVGRFAEPAWLQSAATGVSAVCVVAGGLELDRDSLDGIGELFDARLDAGEATSALLISAE